MGKYRQQYYVLRRRKNDDLSVHYIRIEKRDEQLKSFASYSKMFKDNECIIVDHVTLYNTHYLKKIEEKWNDKLKIQSLFLLRQTSQQMFINLWNLEENFSLMKLHFLTYGREP